SLVGEFNPHMPFLPAINQEAPELQRISVDWCVALFPDLMFHTTPQEVSHHIGFVLGHRSSYRRHVRCGPQLSVLSPRRRHAVGVRVGVPCWYPRAASRFPAVNLALPTIPFPPLFVRDVAHAFL